MAIVALDVRGHWMLVLHKPKLLAKIVLVVLLTANGAVLHRWCFPEMTRPAGPSRRALAGLAVAGALSTTSWLMAAFYGVAKPLQTWSLAGCIGVYALALVAAVPVALVWVALAPPRLVPDDRRVYDRATLPSGRREGLASPRKELGLTRRNAYLGSSERW
jgi:hypothetical protein